MPHVFVAHQADPVALVAAIQLARSYARLDIPCQIAITSDPFAVDLATRIKDVRGAHAAGPVCVHVLAWGAAPPLSAEARALYLRGLSTLSGSVLTILTSEDEVAAWKDALGESSGVCVASSVLDAFHPVAGSIRSNRTTLAVPDRMIKGDYSSRLALEARSVGSAEKHDVARTFVMSQFGPESHQLVDVLPELPRASEV